MAADNSQQPFSTKIQSFIGFPYKKYQDQNKTISLHSLSLFLFQDFPFAYILSCSQEAVQGTFSVIFFI